MPELDYLYVPPTPDDTSQAIGALFAFCTRESNWQKNEIKVFKNPYLGREEKINIQEIKKIINNLNFDSDISIRKYLLKNIAKELINGKS